MEGMGIGVGASEEEVVEHQGAKTFVEHAQDFNLLLFERILQSIDYEDMAVVERMTTGFYFAGVLDPSNVDTVPCEVQPPAITMKVAVIIIIHFLLVLHFIFGVVHLMT